MSNSDLIKKVSNKWACRNIMLTLTRNVALWSIEELYLTGKAPMKAECHGFYVLNQCMKRLAGD